MSAKIAVIVIPTYNEAENIGILIPAILSQQEKIPNYNLQIVIADSHSQDGTKEEVEKIAKGNSQVHYLDVVKRGIGVGLLKGFDFAIERLNAQVLAQMDADFSHDPDDLPKLFEALRGDVDLVIGSRFVKGGANHLPLIRQIFSRGASTVARILTGYIKVREWTTSYRVFRKELYQKINRDRIPWQATSFVFQIAFVVESLRAGAKVSEVPIIFTDRRFGKSKMNTFLYIIHVLLYCGKVRKQRSGVLIKFLIVGTVGFLVNSFLLWLIYQTNVINFLPPPKTAGYIGPWLHPDVRLFVASIIAVEAAIFSNFIFHENWTFKYREKHGKRLTRLVQFNTTSIGSPLITVATVNILTPYFGVFYLISNAIGVVLGMSWNWLWNSRVIWRG